MGRTVLLVGGLLVPSEQARGLPAQESRGMCRGARMEGLPALAYRLRGCGPRYPPARGGGGEGGASQALGPRYRMWSGLPGLELPCGRALMKHP